MKQAIVFALLLASSSLLVHAGIVFVSYSDVRKPVTTAPNPDISTAPYGLLRVSPQALFLDIAAPELTNRADATRPLTGAGIYSSTAALTNFASGILPAFAALFLADLSSVNVANGVPEPLTLLLCGISLVSMAILRRLPDEML